MDELAQAYLDGYSDGVNAIIDEMRRLRTFSPITNPYSEEPVKANDANEFLTKRRHQ